MQTIRSRSIAILGAIAATTFSFSAVSPAHAATNDAAAADDRRQAVVSLAGADLATPEGMIVMDRRIRAAAGRVCGPIDRELSLEVMACRRAAIADAKTRLNDRAVQQFARR